MIIWEFQQQPHQFILKMQYKKQIRISSSSSLKRLQPQNNNHKSLSNWASDIKKIVSHYPTFKNTQVIKKISSIQSKSKGKLYLGAIAKPVIILSKQQRLNPLARKAVISEDILNKKGIFNLANIGIISKQVNCTDLLNNKYELLMQNDLNSMLTKQNNQGFITNPVLSIEEEYMKSKMQAEQTQQPQPKIEKAIKIRQSSKKKILTIQQQPKHFKFQLIEQKPKISISNFKTQDDKVYLNLLKKMKMNGLEMPFKIYIKKLQQFAQKYNIKKLTLIPDLNQTRKLTQKSILNSIVNHKIYGDSLSIFRTFVLMKVQKIRFRQFKVFIQKLSKIINRFKSKKYFRQMTEKRWKFILFKMGSFLQNQRRFIEVQTSNLRHAQIEIHLIATSKNERQLSTFYKWSDRKKIQLTRLYNNTCKQIILIFNHEENINFWLNDIAGINNGEKSCKIHVFYSDIGSKDADECSNLYFGLKGQTIIKIKDLCRHKRTIIVPYEINEYLPRISQLFQANLFAGTLTENSQKILLNQQEIKQSKITEESLKKFKRLSGKNAFEINEFYSFKLKNIQLIGLLLQSKTFFKNILKNLNIQMPITVFNYSDTNQREFYKQLTACILTNKQYSRWIFKTNASSFSRGIAYFQTQSLKIIKQAKKKTNIKEEDIEHIAKIMESILEQKLSIPHNSLLTNEEYLINFKKQGGFVEGIIQNCISLNIFGRIQANGVFTILGTYKKHMTENICFGASYPASQVTEDMLNKSRIISRNLYQLNMFGYVTYELILEEKSKNYFFIDCIPHLEQYSSFHFYYCRMFDQNPFPSKFINKLQKNVLYIPFIDNNGNRCASPKEFNKLLIEKKILFDKIKIEGIKYFLLNEQVDVLSLICFGSSQNNLIRLGLDGLRFLIENGAQFNKFDKRFKNNQCDGLYIKDMIWKMTQIKRDISQK